MIKIPLKLKKELFPEVKDFTKDFNKYKDSKVLGKLGPKEWFYFHPSAIKLMQCSIPIVGIIQFGGLTIYNLIKQNYNMVILFSLALLFFIYLGFKIIPKLKYIDYTFYDLILKESPTFKEYEVKE